MSEFAIGSVCCGCRIMQKISSGSYGTVYLAQDDLGGKLALKICPWSDAVSRELRGLETYYRKCFHPGLIKILAVEKAPGNHIAYTMEAADDLAPEGSEYRPDTLANRLRSSGKLPAEAVRQLLGDLVDALDALHRAGLVHRDLKPDNILFLHGKAVLGDPGLVAPTGNNSLIGTPGFLSEDRLRGKPARPRDDFFALGKVLYCALTGKGAECCPEWPSQLTLAGYNELFRVIVACTETGIDSAAELQEVLAGKPPRQMIRKRRQMIGIGAIFALIAAAAVWLYPFSPKPAAPTPTSARPESPAAPIARSAALNAGVTALQRHNFFAQNHVAELLNYTHIDLAEIMTMLAHPPGRISTENLPPRPTSPPGRAAMELIKIRAKQQARSGSTLVQEIMECFDDFPPECFFLDPKQIKARQEYWRAQPAANDNDKQRRMLSSDPLMLAVALDLTIRNYLNEIVSGGAEHLSREERDELAALSLAREKARRAAL